MKHRDLERIIQSRYCSDEFVRKLISDNKKDEPFGVFEMDAETKQKSLKELHSLYLLGADSEEFFLQMAKVSRRYYTNKALKVVGIVVAVLVGVIVLIRFLTK